MKRLSSLVKDLESTTMADMPSFQHVPLQDFPDTKKKKQLLDLEQVLDRYSSISGRGK